MMKPSFTALDSCREHHTFEKVRTQSSELLRFGFKTEPTASTN